MPESCELALKAMYCWANALARRADWRGSPVVAMMLRTSAFGRRFDLDFFQQFARRGRQVQLPAHALGDFGRVGDEHFGVRFALWFAAARGGDLQRGV